MAVKARTGFVIMVLCAAWGALFVVHNLHVRLPNPLAISCSGRSRDSSATNVLVSYAYYEKDAIQKDNFDFFLRAGVLPPSSANRVIDYVFTVVPGPCTPCTRWTRSTVVSHELHMAGISRIGNETEGIVLYRTANSGMDLASHNVTLEYLRITGRLSAYQYFILLNSSVKGPFFPVYMPPNWHWTDAFLTLYQGNVHAVASSLVCLPVVDAGGPGPRMESWALSLDAVALDVITKAGVLAIRDCKLCSDQRGIVVGGEYGLTEALFAAGYNFATLLSKYAKDTDWHDLKHWGCNDNVHPSREGMYDGISLHPYETVFVKSSWHVADIYTSRYSKWVLAHLAGESGTKGQFDEARYKYAISEEAQRANPVEELVGVV